MNAILDRRIGEHALPKDTLIMIAGNAETDRTGTTRLSLALCDRMAHIDVVPDVDSWVAWAAAAGVAPEIVAFIRWKPELLHAAPDKGERAFPSPRTWQSVARDLSAPRDLRAPIIRAQVGTAAEATLTGFLNVYEKLPSLERCMLDPKGTPVPDDAGARLAIATGLGARCGTDTFAGALEYLERIGPEYEVMCALDATRRDRGLSHTQAFAEFARRNTRLLTAHTQPGEGFGKVVDRKADPAPASATAVAGAALAARAGA